MYFGGVFSVLSYQVHENVTGSGKQENELLICITGINSRGGRSLKDVKLTSHMYLSNILMQLD